MKRPSALLALCLFLVAVSCDNGTTEPDVRGPEVQPPSFAPGLGVPPRSGEIIYTSGTASVNDLFLMDLGANTATNLTNTTSGQNQMPEWSPSGDSIVFSARPGPSGVRELRLMWQKSDGSFSTPQPFLTGCSYPFWPFPPSPVQGPSGSQSFPAWSPDGRHIAFICASGLSGRGQLWVADRDDSGAWRAPRFITPPDLLVSRPVWWKDPNPALAKDGKIIATVLNPNGEGGFQRDMMWFAVPWNGLPNFAGAGGPITATLDIDEDNPSWKYETGVGDVIVYNEIHGLGSSGEASDIYSFTMGIGPAGVPDPTLNSARKQLTHSGSADYPSWTPGGNEILFVQKNGSGVFSVFQMSAAGTAFKNLVNSKSTLSLWAKRRP